MATIDRVQDGFHPSPKEKQPHSWKGSWERPLELDEESVHPFTVARMTDHNVRGRDDDEEDDESEHNDKEKGLH